MSYTQADLDAVRQAKLNLSMGKRVSSVDVNGEKVTFSDVVNPMRVLADMETEIKAALGVGSWSPRTCGKPLGRF